jgi:hypothetical protein
VSRADQPGEVRRAHGVGNLLTDRVLVYGAAATPATLAGAWVGQRVAGRLSECVFVVQVEVGPAMTGVLFLLVPARSVTGATAPCYVGYMPTAPRLERFLLVSISTAGGPASLRVQVWRKLRSLGALYLQQSVCLLPARDSLVREVGRLLARVRSQGAAGRVLTIEVPEEREYAALIADFNAARDAEYAEVMERTPAMLAEIATETNRGRATFAEVEESEADLERFRSWLAKIVARDYFTAPGRAAAEAAVAQCADALAEFEAAALAVETGPDADPDAGRPTAKLRVVKEK